MFRAILAPLFLRAEMENFIFGESFHLETLNVNFKGRITPSQPTPIHSDSGLWKIQKLIEIM
jgi:hypothetical protein